MSRNMQFGSPNEAFFRVLEDNENIIWCGMREENTTCKERGVKGTELVGPVLLIVVSVIFGTVGLVLGNAVTGLILLLPLLLGGVFLLRRALDLDPCYYAITDRRVLGFDGREYFSMGLEKIRFTNVYSSKRGIGSVIFNFRKVEQLHHDVHVGTTYEREVERCDGGFYGIKDPESVERILAELIKKEPHWNGSDRSRT